LIWVVLLLFLGGCSDDDNPVSSSTPAAHRIAFSSNRSGLPQIYVMNSDGTDVNRISSVVETARTPRWSPSGEWVAFRGGDSLDTDVQIFVVSANGTNQADLTKAPGTINLDPNWSPDGSKIAFTSLRDGNSEIYVMNSDGSDQHRLTNNPASDYRPRWSPGGRSITFLSNRDGKNEIYVMQPNGIGQSPITDPPHDVTDYEWSPYSQLAFVSSRSGNEDIYATTWGTFGEAQLTSDSLNQNDPAWSPDGSRVAYKSTDGIHVVGKNGANDQWVPNSNYLGYGLAWFPDGRSLVLANLDSGDFDIISTTLDGTDRRNLTQSPGDDVDPALDP